MDIGTGKDLEEYRIGEKEIPYHLINICEPGYQYNIKEYQQDFDNVYAELQARNTPAILCGGSGLYIESALEGNPYAFVPINQSIRDLLQDESKSRLMSKLGSPIKTALNITSLTTTKRMVRAFEIEAFLKDNPTVKRKGKKLNAIVFAVEMARATILERIISRLETRLGNGMIEEVEKLLAKGLTPEQLLYYGLEYRWVTMYVLGEMTYDEMFDRLNIAIRQFAKRQMTWFRRMEKKGYSLHWLEGAKPINELKEEIINTVWAKK
jgi:tRNA dimethylallyltransferase